MQSLKASIFIAVVLLVIASCSAPAATPMNGDDLMAEQMLNNVMSYIKDRHQDAAPFIRDSISWTMSNTDKRIGYTRSTYAGDSWTVTIGHAITPEMTYEVRAEYKNEIIVWAGTVKDNTITEVSYSKS